MQICYGIISSLVFGVEEIFLNVCKIVYIKNICKWKCFFLFFRLKNLIDNIVFKINLINYQFVVIEINDERVLDLIFEVIGWNVYMLFGVVVIIDGVCKFYVDLVYVCCLSVLLILFVFCFFLIY